MTQTKLIQFTSLLTNFDLEIDMPDDQNAEVWIDISRGDFFTNVSYRPNIGFGVYLEAPEFGQRPDEVHLNPSRAAKRVQQLYRSFEENGSNAALDLVSMRELFEVTQQQLADALGIKQPSVQRVEKRANIQFDTLRNYVIALGGRIESRVVFPDLDARFELATTTKKRVRSVTESSSSISPMSAALDLVVLRAQDPHRLATFYECLGTKFIDEKHGKGPEHKSAMLGETVFEIYPCGANENSSDSRVGFKVMSIAETLKRLEPHLTSPAKLQKTEYGQFVIIQDPEGNHVHLTEASSAS